MYALLIASLLFSEFGKPEFNPNIVMITVDTLRVDRMGIYGYEKPTSPNLDILLRKGTVFRNAHTPEPLTAPALSSMLTSVYPHQHGASRNGLRLRSGLESLPKLLANRGYHTAALISNWTLKNRLTGLGEHFQEYYEVLGKKRWLGLFFSESDANDVTNRSLSWLKHRKSDKPYFLWVHYADPHAPYKYHKDFGKALGITGDARRSERYDTEVAYTDAEIARLLAVLPEDTLIIFASDHGESLGEHNYWGHGRHLFEATLHIPMAIIWPGQVPTVDIEEPAMLMDLAPTLLGLLGMQQPESFRGFDWSLVLADKARPNKQRTMYFQAHKGAVQSKKGANTGRLRGLLEVGITKGSVKEVYRIRNRKRYQYSLIQDPEELKSLVKPSSEMSPGLLKWVLAVEKGLRNIKSDDPSLGETDVEMLRSLGYID